MSAEIAPRYIGDRFPKLNLDQRLNGYSNVFRLSASEQDIENNSHPLIRHRVNRILLANPEVRKQLGCGDVPAQARYCKVDKPFVGTRVEDPDPISSKTLRAPFPERSGSVIQKKSE